MELGQPSTGVVLVPLLTRYLPSASPATSPPLTRALQILADVAQGLMHMHALDPPLIHRDVKSPNILLTASLPDARARLADLGCTKVLRAKTTLF
jgi:serine/threonine protein kinase